MLSNEEMLDLILRDEGGFTNDKRDNGGPTNWGITFVEYQRWRAGRKTSINDLKSMKQEEARQIFKKWYWTPLGCERLPVGVAYEVFDSGILHGIFNAARWLQLAVDAKVDGHVGDKTIQAALAADDATTIVKIWEWRMKRIKGHEDYDRFGTGWTNRALRVKKKALQFVR